MRNRRQQQGFTLLEILIALAIFSLIGIASSQVLHSVLASDSVSQQSAKELTRLQRSYQIIQRDVMQMVARNVRLNGQAPSSTHIVTGDGVIDGEDQDIVFARLGWRNPAQMFPRGTTQVVGYRLVENKLQRLHHLYPDQESGVEPKAVDLLEDVEALKFEYFANKQWQEKWEKPNLPQGVAFIVTTKKYGELRWQFLVPGPSDGS